MPDFNGRITGWVIGDGFSVERTIRFAPADEPENTFPPGTTIDLGWLTIKVNLTDLDAAALVQKVITTTNQPGIGHIENNGAGDVDFVLRFDLTAADTLLIGNRARHFDVQIRPVGGEPKTPQRGLIYGKEQVTIASS
jgi:hypothetical protein